MAGPVRSTPRGAARGALGLLALAAAASARLHWLERELLDEDYAAEGNNELPCPEPVRRAPVHFPDELLVGNAAEGLVMYSGYVNVTARDFLFYWLTEADAGAPDDAPLIVWSNGGPGCSSMEGATTEHGPLVLYDIKDDGELSAGRLSRNPYAWNRGAHVLYVDQPRYVGFSCGTGPFVTSSVDAGRDMVSFLRGWRLLFPEHARRDVILAAESYGGHFVPAWSAAILDYNAAGVADPIRLTGIAIGNGIVNQTIQGGTFPEFARRQGLVPPNLTIDSTWAAREIMKNYLGYEPNYYDYRLMELGCCGCSSYNYRSWGAWMMREDVAKALNVCGDAGAKAFGGCAAGCIQMPTFDGGDMFSYSGELARALEQGIHVTLFYGMQDTACNYVGGFLMANGIEWSGAASFAAAPMEDLRIGGVVTGSIKASGGLTWVQIEGAGHMVPINNPAAASFAIGTLLRNGGRSATSHGGRHAPVLGMVEVARTPAAPGEQVGVLGRYRADVTGLLLLMAGSGVLMSGWAAIRTLRGRSSHCEYDSARGHVQAHLNIALARQDGPEQEDDSESHPPTGAAFQ